MKKGRWSRRNKWFGAFVMSICVALMMTGSAFAAGGGGVSGSAGASSNTSSSVSVIDEGLIKQQREVDDYLFVTHKDELAKQAFKVTHTAPVNGSVEIGITPYEESYAEYLYNIFGQDTVRVVKGEQAYTLVAGPDAPVSDDVVHPVGPTIDSGVATPVPARPALDTPLTGEPAPFPSIVEPEPYMEIAVVGQVPPAEGEMAITSVGQEAPADGEMAITSVGVDAVADSQAESPSNNLLLAVVIALVVTAIITIAYFARRARVSRV